MKVLAKDLQKAVKRLEKVIETKKTLPVLRHVRIRLDGQHLALEATDLDAYLVTRIPVEDGGPIDVVAPFDEIKAAVAVAANATGAVMIAAGEGFRVGPVVMRTLPVEEFPAVPGEGCVEVGTAAEAPLLEALKAVAPAACPEESRYAIRSICWEVREGTFAATDGHRLHVVAAPVQVSESYKDSLVPGTVMEVLMTPRAVQALIACLGKDVVRFALPVDRKILRVTGPDYTLLLRPIDATYPNWRQVLPQDGHAVAVNRRALLEAATKSLKVCRSSGSVTPCLVLTENGSTIDAVLDRGSDQMPVPCGRIPMLGGQLEKDLVIGVNARYLVDALTPMRADAVQVQVRDPVSPLRLSCEGESLRCVVMPMRVDGKGFRILDDESLVPVQGPVPVKPEPETAETEEAAEPEEAVADETGEPEDLMAGEPADDEPAGAHTSTPEEEGPASPEAPEAPQAASVDAPTDQPEDEFPPLEDLLVPAAEAIGRQVVLEATAFEITEVSIRLKGPNGVESYGVRGFLDRLAAA